MPAGKERLENEDTEVNRDLSPEGGETSMLRVREQAGSLSSFLFRRPASGEKAAYLSRECEHRAVSSEGIPQTHLPSA